VCGGGRRPCCGNLIWGSGRTPSVGELVERSKRALGGLPARISDSGKRAGPIERVASTGVSAHVFARVGGNPESDRLPIHRSLPAALRPVDVATAGCLHPKPDACPP